MHAAREVVALPPTAPDVGCQASFNRLATALSGCIPERSRSRAARPGRQNPSVGENGRGHMIDPRDTACDVWDS
jgi:hypothetical protein